MKPLSRENKESVSGAMGEDFGASTPSDIKNSRPGQVLKALFAATQANCHLPKISDGHAEEVAELLIKAVRQVNRVKDNHEE